MALDHRRMLATAIARLRGKIKYRPVVFELMPPAFTLLQLQRTVEAHETLLAPDRQTALRFRAVKPRFRESEIVQIHDVTIIAPVNLPSTVAFHASQMFGRNIFELLKHLVRDGALVLDAADEITGAMMMTHGGQVLR